MSQPTHTTAAEVVAGLRPGMTVYVPGISGESLAFYAALQANPAAAAGVRFIGVHFPGINRSDYLGLHPQARQRAYFMLSGLRAGLDDGRAEWLPLDYPGIYADLSEQAVDLAIAQLAPPHAQGFCSSGACLDFLPAVWARAHRRIGHIHPRLPKTHGSYPVAYTDLDACFEADTPIVGLAATVPDEHQRRHADLVADLVRDGDTLQIGVGKLPTAILHALRGHQGLRLYSGMASSPVAALIDVGAISGTAAIECGVALGDDDFYARIGKDDTFFFRRVGETHDVRRIGGIANFCAINSAIEVDLFGQVNADTINGRCVAGVGGLPSFVAGARLSTGGRSIIALPATTDGGHSRIVATLPAGTATAVARHEADYVVTEYGVAALRGLPLRARAQALIGIAAPAHRPALEQAWFDLERRL